MHIVSSGGGSYKKMIFLLFSPLSSDLAGEFIISLFASACTLFCQHCCCCQCCDIPFLTSEPSFFSLPMWMGDQWLSKDSPDLQCQIETAEASSSPE